MAKGGRGSGKREAGISGASGGSQQAEVDALFQLPLMEFTAARNALAARWKKAGRAEEADHVKALPKPSVSAWVVNQLYWQHQKAFEQLIAIGERFRTAQLSHLAGKSADIRGPLESRRAALSELAHLAAGTLRKAGHNPTPDTMRRITMTLEAISTYGSLPEAPPAGRLTDDVDPPGFETLTTLVPRVGRPRVDGPSRIIPFQQHMGPQRPSKKKVTPDEKVLQREEERKAQLAAAKAAVHDAEEALRDTRKAAQQAEAALKSAASRAKETEKDKVDAEQRLEKAAAAFEEARQQARKIAVEAEEAAQAVADAERALEKAKGALETIER